MDKKVVMPKIGKEMVNGTIVSWEKQPGDKVEDGEVLFVMNNGKIDMEIESAVNGTVKSIAIAAGESAHVGTVLAVIEESACPAEHAAKTASPAVGVTSKVADKTSVIVIGGGPGGYVAAIRASQLGAEVTLIEKAEIGGTCLNRGCMPTKALLHSSEIYESATKSEEAGIIGENVKVNWTQVQKNRANVTAKLTGGVGALMKANKIKVINGQASFVGAKKIKVGDSVLEADKIIIAAGSFPIVPNISGVKDSKAVIDSTGALTLDHIPESLVVIGGGVIGLELGSVYNTFGTKVTVIEMMPKFLPLMDAELTEMVRTQLENKGMSIFTAAKVVSVVDTDSGAVVKTECKDGIKDFQAEKVLVCVGRGPLTEALNLDKAGVKTEKGYICTNDYMETNVEGVYAVGDCNGKLQLAHAAMAMGEAAAENAMGGHSTFIAEESPSCCYVGPEFAGVGMTEEQAKECGIKYKVGRFPTSGNGRSLVMCHTDGMIKVIAGEEYGEILGVHILAPHATDLIEEAALAIKLEATVDEIAKTIHCHPTVAEALREGVLAADGRAIHRPNKKKSSK